MARVLLISEKYIKENSPIDDNVDMKKILPTIWQCQIQYIQNLLGTQLYDDILSKVEAGTIAGNDLKLVNDYVADCLLYYFMYEFQIPSLFSFRNVSTSKNNSDFSNPIDTKELSRIENKYKDKAEFFAKRVSDYLCANTNLYPLYLRADKADDVIPEKGYPSVSVYLGERQTPKCNKFLYTNEEV